MSTLGKERSKCYYALVHYRRILQICVLASLAQHSPAAFSAPLRVDGLRAEHLVLELGSDRVFERNRIALSEDGLRIDQANHGFRILANYQTEQLWLIDRSRMIVHSVPATFVDKSDNSPLQRVRGSESPVLTDTGLLAHKACEGLVELDQFESIWRGKPVSISTCGNHEHRPVVRHWFNADAGLVVRSMTPDGRIEELRDIRPLSLAPGFFEVSDKLRDVDISEFLLGTSELGRFPAFSDEDLHESSTDLKDLPSGQSGHFSQKE